MRDFVHCCAGVFRGVLIFFQPESSLDCPLSRVSLKLCSPACKTGSCFHVCLSDHTAVRVGRIQAFAVISTCNSASSQVTQTDSIKLGETCCGFYSLSYMMLHQLSPRRVWLFGKYNINTLKPRFHQKKKKKTILSSFTHPPLLPKLFEFFSLLNTQDIWKHVENW